MDEQAKGRRPDMAEIPGDDPNRNVRLQQMLESLNLQLIPAVVRNETPHELDYDSISSQVFAKFLKDTAIPRLSRFLNRPIVKDSFGSDHTARRRWQAKIPQEYAKLYQELDGQNKLRWNNILPLFTLRERIKDFLEELKSVGEKEKQIEDQLGKMPLSTGGENTPENYNSLTLDGKIEYLKRMDVWILDFFKIFEKRI